MTVIILLSQSQSFIYQLKWCIYYISSFAMYIRILFLNVNGITPRRKNKKKITKRMILRREGMKEQIIIITITKQY